MLGEVTPHNAVTAAGDVELVDHVAQWMRELSRATLGGLA